MASTEHHRSHRIPDPSPRPRPGRQGRQVIVSNTGTTDRTYLDTTVQSGKTYLYRVKSRAGSYVSTGSSYARVEVPYSAEAARGSAGVRPTHVGPAANAPSARLGEWRGPRKSVLRKSRQGARYSPLAVQQAASPVNGPGKETSPPAAQKLISSLS